MPQINLADYLPAAADGSKTLLPKQGEFFRSALDPKGPKYNAYIGGIGSGKSVIGCETMLALATMEVGDYLVCRQYMPELKITTYKTFLELCPPELIVEHRIADATLRIRARNGVSNIYFRPLEEPDKLRSLNLNAFLIDEANQVTEEAFLLLQGRLRGRAWRKGFICSNPNGHDFIYRLFFVKAFKNEWIRTQYSLIRAPSTENRHLPEGYLESLMASWSEERIQREIEGSFDAFEGAVYHEFRRDAHVIQPFVIPPDWPRYIGIDHGLRNPEAWIWVAVGPDGEVYVYREFYETEMTIQEIVHGKRLSMNDWCMGTMARMRYGLPNGDKIVQAVIDPSTKNRKGNGESDWDEYTRQLPADFPLYKAQNDVQTGIDRVKGYLKVQDKVGKPSLYIFNDCKNLIEEMTQYKYPELRPNQEGKRAENEKPMKVNDHALDALRYVIMLLPEAYTPNVMPKPVFPSLQQKLRLDIESTKSSGPKDPFSMGF